MKRFAILAALLACANPAIAQTAVQPSVNYATAPVAAGTWSYVPLPGGSDARFTDTTGTMRLVIHCTKASRVVTVSRISTAPASALQVWTDSATRNLAARFEPNAFRISANIAAQDRLLDAIAFSRGRFAIIAGGIETLVVPAWPEPARVVEDCRN